MFNMPRIIGNPRTFKALIGMSTGEFEELLITFTRILQEHSLSKPRQRVVGGGRKGALGGCPARKLFFVLFYLKVYPTFDVLGALFSKPRGRSCEEIHRLTPLLEATLGRKLVLPERKIGSIEALRQRFCGIKDMILDGMERPIQRPRSSKRQRRHYSGKKKAIGARTSS